MYANTHVHANNSLGTRVNNNNPPRCGTSSGHHTVRKGEYPDSRKRQTCLLPPETLLRPAVFTLSLRGTSAVRLTPVATGRDIYYSFYTVLVSDASTQTKPFNATLRAQTSTTHSTDLLYSF